MGCDDGIVGLHRSKGLAPPPQIPVSSMPSHQSLGALAPMLAMAKPLNAVSSSAAFMATQSPSTTADNTLPEACPQASLPKTIAQAPVTVPWSEPPTSSNLADLPQPTGAQAFAEATRMLSPGRMVGPAYDDLEPRTVAKYAALHDEV